MTERESVARFLLKNPIGDVLTVPRAVHTHFYAITIHLLDGRRTKRSKRQRYRRGPCGSPRGAARALRLLARRRPLSEQPRGVQGSMARRYGLRA